jgi:hypothetical protein
MENFVPGEYRIIVEDYSNYDSDETFTCETIEELQEAIEDVFNHTIEGGIGYMAGDIVEVTVERVEVIPVNVTINKRLNITFV